MCRVATTRTAIPIALDDVGGLEVQHPELRNGKVGGRLDEIIVDGRSIAPQSKDGTP